MTFNPLRLLWVAVLLTSFIQAQTPSASKERPAEFRVTSWNLDLPELFFEQNGKKTPLPVFRRNLTQPQTLAAPSKLVLYTPTLTPEGVVKTTVAELTLAAPPRKNLVIVWREINGRFGSAVLSDDPETPPPGHLRFVNLAGQNLALQCNGMERFTLSPGAEKVVPPTNGGVGVGVKIARQVKPSDSESWQLALMSGIPVEPDVRVTAFIVDPSRLALPPEKESIVGHLEKEILSFFIINDHVAK